MTSHPDPASRISDATWATYLPADLREMYEERAAIMEYEGGLARAVAQARARAECEAILRERDGRVSR